TAGGGIVADGVQQPSEPRPTESDDDDDRDRRPQEQAYRDDPQHCSGAKRVNEAGYAGNAGHRKLAVDGQPTRHDQGHAKGHDQRLRLEDRNAEAIYEANKYPYAESEQHGLGVP